MVRTDNWSRHALRQARPPARLRVSRRPLSGSGMTEQVLTYVFRRPQFPIICDVDRHLVAGASRRVFQRRIARLQLPPNRLLPIVDATGEGWALHTDLRAVSPLTLKKRWTKMDVIQMFNNSVNAARSGSTYPARSLASKPLKRVIGDIVELVGAANQCVSPPPGGRRRAEENP